MIKGRTAVVALVTIGISLAAACGFDGAGAIDGDLLEGGDRLPDGALRDPESGGSSGNPGDANGGSDGNVGANDGSSNDGASLVDGGGDAADGSIVGPPTCASLCAAAGGTCAGGTCQIHCTTSAPCNALVVCPPGLPCKVTCDKDGCQTGVDCEKASSCDITCGEQACGDVACAGSTCNVLCDGNGKPACRGAVVCHASSTCHITCSGGGKACQEEVVCSGASCAVDCSPNQNASCSSGQCCDAGSCTTSPTNTCP